MNKNQNQFYLIEVRRVQGTNVDFYDVVVLVVLYPSETFHLLFFRLTYSL